MGIEFEDITQAVHKLLDVDVFLAIDKQFLNRENWDRMQQKLGRNVNWDEFANSVAVSRTTPTIPAPVASHIAGLSGKHVRQSGEIEWDGRVAQSIMLPFVDLRGRELGEIVVLRDVTAAASDARRALVSVVAACAVVGGALLAWTSPKSKPASSTSRPHRSTSATFFRGCATSFASRQTRRICCSSICCRRRCRRRRVSTTNACGRF